MCICTLLLAKVVFPLEQIPETECGNMTKTTETMGMRIREQRIKMHMTQEKLAEEMSIPKTTISAYENDKVDIKGSVLMELSQALLTTPNYLLGFCNEDKIVEEMSNVLCGIKDEKTKKMLLVQIKAVAEQCI